MEKHLIAYYIGITVVFGSHIAMLMMNHMKAHAIANLIAGVLIAYYFMNKEKITSY